MLKKQAAGMLIGAVVSLNLFGCQPAVSAGYLWNDGTEIFHLSRGLHSDFYKSRDSLIRSAEKAETETIPVLTDKTVMPPSRDKRDYVSMAIYYWPDMNQPEGRPYVQDDGHINPERDDTARYDNKRLQTMVGELRSLARGYAVSGREDFADRAMMILDTWFIDAQTRMNPNLEYAQIVPGYINGRKSGIIDTVALIEVLDDIQMLQSSAAYTDARREALRSWFGDYATWLQTSQNGIKEGLSKNNHGVWYDAQLAAFSHFAGDDNTAKAVLQAVPLKRMESQIASDGSLPLELARTRPMNYSLYTLRAYLTLARLGEELGVNLYDAKTKNGAGLKTAIDYILPYTIGAKALEKTDVAPWKADAFLYALHIANKHYKNPAYEVKIVP